MQALAVGRIDVVEGGSTEIGLALHVLHVRGLVEAVHRGIGDALAEQRHDPAHAQLQVDVGTAHRHAPGTIDQRERDLPANLGQRHVAGAAADVQDHDPPRALDAAVVAIGRGGGFLEELDLVEAGRAGGIGNDVLRLRIAILHRAAEAHRAADHRRAHLAAQLRRGGLADVAQDVGGDAQQHVARMRLQLVAEHRLGRDHQVALAGGQERIHRLVAVQRVVDVHGFGHRLAHLAGDPIAAHRGHRRAPQFIVAAHAQLGDQRQGLAAARLGQPGRILAQLLQPRHFPRLLGLHATDHAPHLLVQFLGQLEIVGIGQPLREEHRGAELLLVAEADQLHLAIHHCAGRRITGAEVDPDAHATTLENRPAF